MGLQRALRVLVMVIAVTALYALVRWCWNVSVESAHRASAALTAWRDSQPPRALPLRPGDRERYPRRGFGLLLESKNGFRIDTFAGRATKDLAERPDTTIDLRLSDAQLDTLYETIIRMRLFDYPEPRPPIRSDGLMSSGDTVRFLVRAGDSTKLLTWDTRELPREPIPDEWKRLTGLVRMVSRMVWTHPAFGALPTDRRPRID